MPPETKWYCHRHHSAACASSVLNGKGNPVHAEVAMAFKGLDQFGKFRRRLPGRAGYCVDCLSHLYGEPVETMRGYLSETGIASRQAHCGNCGEHKDIVTALLPPSLIRYSSGVPAPR
jgi:hypothetical protein